MVLSINAEKYLFYFSKKYNASEKDNDEKEFDGSIKPLHTPHVLTCCLSATGGLGKKSLLLLLGFQSHPSFSGCWIAS